MAIREPIKGEGLGPTLEFEDHPTSGGVVMNMIYYRNGTETGEYINTSQWLYTNFGEGEGAFYADKSVYVIVKIDGVYFLNDGEEWRYTNGKQSAKLIHKFSAYRWKSVKSFAPYVNLLNYSFVDGDPAVLDNIETLNGTIRDTYSCEMSGAILNSVGEMRYIPRYKIGGKVLKTFIPSINKDVHRLRELNGSFAFEEYINNGSPSFTLSPLNAEGWGVVPQLYPHVIFNSLNGVSNDDERWPTITKDDNSITVNSTKHTLGPEDVVFLIARINKAPDCKTKPNYGFVSGDLVPGLYSSASLSNGTVYAVFSASKSAEIEVNPYLRIYRIDRNGTTTLSNESAPSHSMFSKLHAFNELNSYKYLFSILDNEVETVTMKIAGVGDSSFNDKRNGALSFGGGGSDLGDSWTTWDNNGRRVTTTPTLTVTATCTIPVIKNVGFKSRHQVTPTASGYSSNIPTHSGYVKASIGSAAFDNGFDCYCYLNSWTTEPSLSGTWKGGFYANPGIFPNYVPVFENFGNNLLGSKDKYNFYSSHAVATTGGYLSTNVYKNNKLISNVGMYIYFQNKNGYSESTAYAVVIWRNGKYYEETDVVYKGTTKHYTTSAYAGSTINPQCYSESSWGLSETDRAVAKVVDVSGGWNWEVTSEQYTGNTQWIYKPKIKLSGSGPREATITVEWMIERFI